MTEGSAMARRIVLTTYGSLGDLYPYISVALGLKARGHDVVIATANRYREKVERHGIGFHAVRPEAPDLNSDHDVMRSAMDSRYGTEHIIKNMVMPFLRDSYEDLTAAAQGADLLVSHILTYAARLVAEKTGVAWASTYLQPVGLLSAYDPPILAQARYLSKVRFLGPAFHKVVFWLGKKSCAGLARPWHRLRAELGLPRISDNPLFEGSQSPALVLAMFSPEFAQKQPDWPARTVVTGFPFFDTDDQAGMSPELKRFLDEGPAPIVFTLGSSGLLNAGSFYEYGAAAAESLGQRAILIVGTEPGNRPKTMPKGVIASEYVPFAQLFPRASLIVHIGGIGTTGLAMQAGVPMLIVPQAHDQFDNAARVIRIGIGRKLLKERFSRESLTRELELLLNDERYAQRAAKIGEAVRRENGVSKACDELEKLLPAP
jgi:rhamnosyltransferase subunit B